MVVSLSCCECVWLRARETHVLQLPLVEEGDGVDDDPGERSAKVDELVHDETHNTRRDCVILHPEVPGLGGCQHARSKVLRLGEEVRAYRPETLGNIEVDGGLGDLVEDIREGSC